MADLYNLDAELEQGMRYGDDTVIDNDDNDVDNDVNANNTATTNNNDDDDDEPYESFSNQTTSFNVPVPDALQEAAMARQKQLNSNTANHDDGDDYDNEDIRTATTKGLWNFQSNDPLSSLLNTTNTQQVKHNQYEQLQNLSYTKLYNIWVQECHAPELLPYPYDIIHQVRKGLLQYELYMEEKENTDNTNTYCMSQNENLNALIDSLLRIDVERVKFLLSDLLQRRIQKITKYTQYYHKQFILLQQQQQQEEEELGDDSDVSSNKNHPLMCEAEITLLHEYMKIVKHHLSTTVTNHFPQDVWRTLDIPNDMVHEPNIHNQFVFIKCIQDVTIPETIRSTTNNDETTIDPMSQDSMISSSSNGGQYQQAGMCLIVRYERIRQLLLEGKVELI